MTYIEAKGLLLANKDQACKKAKQKGNQRSSSCQQGSTPSHDHAASRLVKIKIRKSNYMYFGIIGIRSAI